MARCPPPPLTGGGYHSPRSDAEKSWQNRSVQAEHTAGRIGATTLARRPRLPVQKPVLTPPPMHPSHPPLSPCHPQPQRTKSDAEESWEVKAEKGKVEAPPAGSSNSGAATATRSGSGSTPFANEGSTAAAAADDGRARYTLDFMKTLREAGKEAPADLAAGEWSGTPPVGMPGTAAYGPGGDRGLGRRCAGVLIMRFCQLEVPECLDLPCLAKRHSATVPCPAEQGGLGGGASPDSRR